MSDSQEFIQPPDRHTIPRHLVNYHGYTHDYAYSAHPSVLTGEHIRIHEDLTHLNLDHRHKAES